MRKVAAAVCAFAAVGCARVTISNSPDTQSPTAPPPSPPPVAASNANLVNAFDYYAESNGQPGYYFTTPSGKWRCAIIPRNKAGCQPGSGSSMGVAGAPATVPGAAGADKPPNAILVEFEGDARFAALDPSALSPTGSQAKSLPFNRVLAAAGFRCNVQESGVSCVSDATGKAFTFSADGYTLTYTDVPTAPR
jgi:hypothetical protein